MDVIPHLVIFSLFVINSWGCHFYPDKVYGGTFADCSRQNLSSMAIDLPANTSSLNLRYNIFYELNVPTTADFKNLKYLDVSHNRLSRLQPGTFKPFEGLLELYLNNNILTLRRTSYPDDIFKPLKSVLKIHLHGNDKSIKGSYPEKAFEKLPSLQELKLDTFIETDFGTGFSKLINLKRLLLGFTGCKLEQLNNRTFENFSNSSLTMLNLSHCPIVKLETGSFLSLKSLKYLYMSQTITLSSTFAVLSMYGLRGRNLSSIEMNTLFSQISYKDDQVSYRILSNEFLIHLQHVCVERFSMANNQLLWIGNSIFSNDTKFGKCIKHLDLSNNDLYGDISVAWRFYSLPNIVSLNLSTKARAKAVTNVPGIRLNTPTYGIELPSTLKILNLDGMATIQVNMRFTFHVYNARSLRHLSFAYNDVYGLIHRLLGLENLTSLDGSGSILSGMNPAFFDDFPNLESLYLSNVNFGDGDLFRYGKRLFSPMENLNTINLSKNNMRLLESEIFSSNQIREIIISHNRFESIPFDLKTTPKLDHLNLAFNSLAVLSHTEMNLLEDLASKHSITLNLEGNLLSCGCRNLDFMLWMFTTKVEVTGVLTYKCQMSDGSITNTTYIRDHYEEIWRSCNSMMIFSVTLSLLAVFAIVTVFVSATIRRKTLLVNILLRVFGFGPLPPTPTRDDFDFDVYIGYSDADYQYICHTVRGHLENTHGLRLFIRDRDTIPGENTAEEIISAIDSSWRIVLFLTAAFLDDQWYRFTVHQAVYSSTGKPLGRVLLVLSDDFRRGDIDPTLLNVVEERDIFFIVRYRGDEHQLWKDISDRLKETILP